MKPMSSKKKMAAAALSLGAALGLFQACNQIGNGYGLDASGNLLGSSQAGCPETAVSPAAGDTSATPISFANQIQPIFTSKCIQCHAVGGVGYDGTGGANGGLDLTTGNSYASIVDVAAFQKPTVSPFFRVTPGNPDCSYLIQKISSSTPKEGGKMPLAQTALSDAEINLIKQWIQHGAPQ
jgi:mono/diheme cytochrome c family protein